MSSYLDFAFLAYDFVTADIVDHYSVLKVRRRLTADMPRHCSLRIYFILAIFTVTRFASTACARVIGTITVWMRVLDAGTATSRLAPMLSTS